MGIPIENYLAYAAPLASDSLFDVTQYVAGVPVGSRKITKTEIESELTFFNALGDIVGASAGSGFLRHNVTYPESLGFNDIVPDQNNSFFAKEFRGDATVNENILTSKSSIGFGRLGENAFPYAEYGIQDATDYHSYYVERQDISMNYNKITDGLGNGFMSINSAYTHNPLNLRRWTGALSAGDTIIDSERNDNAYTTQNTLDVSPVGISQRNGTVDASIKNADWSGLGINVKTSNTRYANQFAINQDSVAFETVLAATTPTADRTVTFPDATGTVIYNVVEDTTPQLGGALDCQANTVTFEEGTKTGTGAQTIDFTTGNKQKFTFGAGNATFTFTAPAEACSLMLVIIQDGTGSRTVTFPASVKWSGGTAPVLSTGIGAVDLIAFYFDGTSYYGSSSLDFS